jgi:N-ethylmaleimide reductase
MEKLFTPVKAGDITLSNRVIMAPLTRSRSPGGIPDGMNALYYKQRASAGLIISEGTPVSEQGQGYADVPGLFRKASLDGWKHVTDEVHRAGGKIVAQLWHVGRLSHTSLQPYGGQPVAPSEIAAEATSFIIDRNGNGVRAPASDPRALTVEGIQAIIHDFGVAARNAMDCGFDGVEIHAANGYLIEQFVKSSTNLRSDNYGGSLENRARFLLDVTKSVCDAAGAGKTGLRISPTSTVNDIFEPDPQPLYNYIAKELGSYGLAFMHIVEGQPAGARDHNPEGVVFDYAQLRNIYRNNGGTGLWMVNNAYDRKMAIDAVETGEADAVSFGRDYISNPDLFERLRENCPLTPSNKSTYYGGDAEGYIDYPPAQRVDA